MKDEPEKSWSNEAAHENPWGTKLHKPLLIDHCTSQEEEKDILKLCGCCSSGSLPPLSREAISTKQNTAKPKSFKHRVT